MRSLNNNSCSTCPKVTYNTIINNKVKGSDNPDVYFITYGLSYEEVYNDQYPLSGEAGIYLYNLLSAYGIVSSSRIAALKRCNCEDPDNMIPCMAPIINDINESNPKVIVGLGSKVCKLFLRDKYTTMSSISGSIYKIKISGKEIPFVPLFSPEYIIENKDNTQLLERYSREVKRVSEIGLGIYQDKLSSKVIKWADNYEDFKSILENNLSESSTEKLAYDIETNAKPPMDINAEIIGFSLASRELGVYVCLRSLEYDMPEEDRTKSLELLTDVLKSRKLIVHNSMYERPYSLSQLGYELTLDQTDDTLVMARLMLGGKIGAGLKPQAQMNLGYPDWETDLTIYLSNYRSWLSRMIGLASCEFLVTEILNGKYSSIEELSDDMVADLSRSKSDKIYGDKISLEFSGYWTAIKDVLLRHYSQDEITKVVAPAMMSKAKELFATGSIPKVLPYNYIPKKILCDYGAVDSLATYDLYDYYVDVMTKESTDTVDLFKGYRVWLEHSYVGYVMERNGAYWDEDVVSADECTFNNIAVNALKEMLLSPLMKNKLTEIAIKYYYPQILSDYYPEIARSQGYEVEYDRLTGKYLVFTLNPKRKRAKKDALWSIVIPRDMKPSIEELAYNKMVKYLKEEAKTVADIKPIYNPASKNSRDVPRSVLVTNDLKFGNTINQLAVMAKSPEYSEEVMSKMPDVIKNLFSLVKKITDDKSLKSEYGDNWISEKRKLYHEFVEFYFNRIKEISSYIKLPKPIEIESYDDETIIEIYNSYKSTGIDPDDKSTWSEEFKWLINYRLFKKTSKIVTSYILGTVGRKSVTVVDKESMRRGDKVVKRKRWYDEGKAKSDEDYLIASKFGVNTVTTGRWKCFTGDTRVMSLDGKSYSFKELVDNNISELWVYARNDQGDLVPAKAINPHITKIANRLVKLELDDGSVIRCTPDHQFRLCDGSYKNAEDLNDTDNLSSLDLKDYQMYVTEGPLNILHITYNHKIVSVSIIEDANEEVYDLEVPEYHNFCIECSNNSGVFVHNSGFHTLPWQSPVKRYYGSRFIGGTIFCLTGDTKILLANGDTVTIESLANSGYTPSLISYDTSNDQYVASTSVNPRMTKKVKELVKITFSNGESIRCTNDHPILLAFSQGYKNSAELRPGDKIQALYRRTTDSDYWRVVGKLFASMIELNLNITINTWNDNLELLRTRRSAGIKLMADKEYSRYTIDKLLAKDSFSRIVDMLSGCLEVSRVDTITLDEEVPVYDITVPEYENFVIMTSSKEAIVVHNCPDYCLSGDTKIPLADGSVRLIKDLVNESEFEVISYDSESKSYKIGRGHDCRLVRNSATMYELTLDNGEVVKCTPEHKFLTTKGYVTAMELDYESEIIGIHTNQGSVIESVNLKNKVSSTHSSRVDKQGLQKIKYLYELLRYDNVSWASFEDWDKSVYALDHKNPSFNRMKRYSNNLKQFFDTAEEVHQYMRSSYKLIDININKQAYEDTYCFTVDDYHNFVLSSGVVSSNSQMEVRSLASASDEDTMLEAFRNGADIHRFNACFTGDTKVILADGSSVSFEELTERYKYTCPYNTFEVYSLDDDNNVVIGQAYYPRVAKIAPVVEVHLNNGSVIKCTADHKWRTYRPNQDHGYVEASKLVAGDTILTLSWMDKDNQILHYNFDTESYESIDGTIIYQDDSISPLVVLKVVSVSDEPVKVYDLTVHKYHNFAIDSSTPYKTKVGAFVSNSKVWNKPMEEVTDAERRFSKMSTFCFTGNTVVMTSLGLKSLEELYESYGSSNIPEFEVLGVTDEGNVSYNPAYIRCTGESSKLVRITISSDNDTLSYIECTPEHRIMINSSGKLKYVEAKDLNKGDQLVSYPVLNSSLEVISVVMIEHFIPVKLYDIESQLTHNFVVMINPERGLVVHNCLLYGGTEEGFAENFLNGDLARAHEIYEGFFSAFPKIKTWVAERQKECLDTGKVTVKSGRFIKIRDDISYGAKLRQSMNYPIQAFSSDIVGSVIYSIEQYIEQHNYHSKIFLFVHDSIEIDVPPYELLSLMANVQIILNTVPIERFNTPSKADVALGKSLGHEIEMKSIKSNDDYTEALITLAGFYDEIIDTINEWVKAYKTVLIIDEDFEDIYISYDELFIVKKAYSTWIGSHRKEGKMVLFISYYNEVTKDEVIARYELDKDDKESKMKEDKSDLIEVIDQNAELFEDDDFTSNKGDVDDGSFEDE